MANDDLSEEIQLLRKQLEELQKQQEAPESQSPSEEEKAPVADEQGVAKDEARSISKVTNDDIDVGQELVDQFKDLLDSIDKDIKDTKPSTLLIVFALGVLVGRL